MSDSRPLGIRQVFSHLLNGFIVVYCLMILSYSIARATVGEAWDVVQLLNNLMPLLLLPSLALLLPLSITRRWRLALLVMPGVIGFGLLYGGALLPRGGAALAPTLAVMTYNVHDTNRNFEAIAAEIRRSGADIALVEEITPDTAQALTPMLRDVYPYSALYPFHPDRLGIGVYSRLPLTDQEFLRFSQESSLLRFNVTFDGQAIRVYGVHAANPFTKNGYDPYPHNLAIGKLLDQFRDETAPLIVAGDFNMTDQTGDYSRMTAVLTDSYHEAGAGLGLTFPSWSPIPLVRIDYVFHNAAFAAVNAQVSGTSGNSDHYPLRVDLAFAH